MVKNSYQESIKLITQYFSREEKTPDCVIYNWIFVHCPDLYNSYIRDLNMFYNLMFIFFDLFIKHAVTHWNIFSILTSRQQTEYLDH